MSPGSSDGAKKISKKPIYSRFTQQELPAWKPILTPGWVISIFILLAVVFIPIGLISFSASEHVEEIVERYDMDCVSSTDEKDILEYIRNSNTNKTCTKILKVQKKMKSPVFIYYQLDKFYQNHRRYVKSRSDKQLRNKEYEDETKDCFPLAKINNDQSQLFLVASLLGACLTTHISLR